jgi:hypothetical protein
MTDELLPTQDERIDADCPCACHELGVADSCLSVCCALARNKAEIDTLRLVLRDAESDLRCIRLDLSDLTQATRVQRVIDRLRAALSQPAPANYTGVIPNESCDPECVHCAAWRGK